MAMAGREAVRRAVQQVHLCHRFASASASAAGPREPLPNQNQKRATVGLTQPPDPETVSSDYIGPPDANSNLRPYVRHFDANETPLEQRLRLRRIEVEEWNMDFWTRHNKRFYEEKSDFVRLHNLANGKDGSEEIPADSMSIFYKSFLDQNRRIHLMYNLSWYLKNFDILTLALQVQLQTLLRRVQGKGNKK